MAHHLTEQQMAQLVQFHPAYSYEDFFAGPERAPRRSARPDREAGRGDSQALRVRSA
nr:hypothetical protein [Gandjariella thermophila]